MQRDDGKGGNTSGQRNLSSAPEMLLATITISFLESAERDSFNGLVASRLLKFESDQEKLRSYLEELLAGNYITCVYASTDENIHIKRFPDHPIQKQIELLETESLDDFCIYPTADTVGAAADIERWNDRPYSQQLALAEPQLSFKSFEMGVLERYMGDPRYTVDFADYMGHMSIDNETYGDIDHPERDKVSLQTFGLGFDQNRMPFVVVFLRYLASLSPEHQQLWKSYETRKDVRMCRQYYQSCIEGNFWENRSIRYAIAKEMELINAMFKAIWNGELFRKLPSDDIPISLTFFLRPTAENYHRFVMAMDKLLSENIDTKFFKGRIPLETETERDDGKIIVQPKGSLALLEEWLLSEYRWSDAGDFRKIIMGPIRRARRERQRPAHEFTNNEYSTDYYQQRKELLWDVFNSLSNIRYALSKHRLARAIVVPDWLNGENLDVF